VDADEASRHAGVVGRVRVGALVCSGPARAEQRGCWARAAAKARRRGESQGGGGRGRSGAGSVAYTMRRAVRTRGVLLVVHAIRRLARAQLAKDTVLLIRKEMVISVKRPPSDLLV
jgi:hypothetical protein